MEKLISIFSCPSVNIFAFTFLYYNKMQVQSLSLSILLFSIVFLAHQRKEKLTITNRYTIRKLMSCSTKQFSHCNKFLQLQPFVVSLLFDFFLFFSKKNFSVSNFELCATLHEQNTQRQDKRMVLHRPRMFGKYGATYISGNSALQVSVEHRTFAKWMNYSVANR